ncbi:MAG: hypothetical protein JW809_03945 [Pirellulales bacterium]|nr:hypothetical protein [Pirellulales bacterium]
MSKDARRQRVRRRAGRVGLALPALVFLGAGLPVYLLGLNNRAGVCEPARTSLSATVELPRSLADDHEAQTAVLAPAALARAADRAGLPNAPERLAQVHEALRVSTSPSPEADRTQVVVGYDGPESPMVACRLVNALAEQYAESRRSALASAAKKTHREAQRTANRARTELFEARSRFETFVDQHFAGSQSGDGAEPSPTEPLPPGVVLPSPSPPATPAAPSAPPTPSGNAHPDWARLARQLAAVKAHREQLLVDRTPLHPQVRDADVEIADLERRLAELSQGTIPSPSDLGGTLESMTGVPPAAPDPVASQPMPSDVPARGAFARPGLPRADLITAFLARRDAMDRARDNYERLADAEREAFEAQFHLPRVTVRPADAPAGPLVPRPTPRGLVIALAVGLAGAVGMGMFSAGVAGEQTFATAVEVGDALGVPVLGTVPGAEPLVRRLRPRRTADAWALLACGLVLLTICLGMLLAFSLGMRWVA